jgi:hypothetical protein
MNYAVPTTTADVRAAIATVNTDARDLAGSLSNDQLNWQPSPKSWSVGQCLEHLTVTANLYAVSVDRATAKAKAIPGGASDGTLELSFIGRFAIRSLTTTGKKFTVPKRFAPPSSVGREILREFEEAHQRLAALLDDVEGRPLARMKTSSPVSRLIRLNVADCFAILVVHAHRHLQQAKRVMETTGFPAAGA